MPLFNSPDRWGALAKLFHWGMAILILGLFAYGLYIADFLDDYSKGEPIKLHKSLGLLVLGLVALRLVWRLIGGRAPALPAHMPTWEKGAAHLGHLALYALMILMPLSGWWSVSAAPLNVPAAIFGVNLPALTTPDSAAALAQSLGMIDAKLTGLDALGASWGFWKETHGAIAWLLVVVVAVHAGAALKHHFIARDSVLRRMLPFG